MGPLCGPWCEAAQELQWAGTRALPGLGSSATLDPGTWQAAWQDLEEPVEWGHLPCRGCSFSGSPKSLNPSESLRDVYLTLDGGAPVKLGSAHSLSWTCAWQQSLFSPEDARGLERTGNAAGGFAHAVPAAGLLCPAEAHLAGADLALAAAQAVPLAAGQGRCRHGQCKREASLEAVGGTPTPLRSL